MSVCLREREAGIKRERERVGRTEEETEEMTRRVNEQMWSIQKKKKKTHQKLLVANTLYNGIVGGERRTSGGHSEDIGDLTHRGKRVIPSRIEVIWDIREHTFEKGKRCV